MCGRYIYDEFESIVGFTGESDAFRSRRNQAGIYPGNLDARPSQVHPIGISAGGEPQLDASTWGVYRDIGGKQVLTINARCENLHFTYPEAYLRPGEHAGRCIVFATGFFEWQKPSKQKFLIARTDGQSCAFAGVWLDAPRMGRKFVIITCPPAPEVAQIHNRQPVILEQREWQRWIDPKAPSTEQKRLLTSLPAGSLTAERCA